MRTSPHLLSNEQLIEVFNLTPTATAIHVGETAIIQSANNAMLEIWGKDKGVIGKSLEEALPELKGQPFIDMFKRVWNEGLIISGKDTPADLEINGIVKTFYFDFEYRAIKNDAGETICILHTAIDVTDRFLKKEAIERAQEKELALQREQALNEELAATNEELVATNEELQETQDALSVLNAELEARVDTRVRELMESEERFKNMAEATDIFIAVGDENGMGTYFNSNWTELTGRPINDLMAFGWTDLLHVDDRNEIINLYQSALKLKEEFTGEFRITSKSGDYKWLLAKGSPRFRSDGAFLGFISSCIDITDRKLYELERQNLNSLIEASSEFIGLSDLSGNIEYLNPAALNKLGWDGFQNRSLMDCVYPEDRLVAEDIFKELVSKGNISYEIRFWNEESKVPFWIEWNGFFIKDALNHEVIALANVSPDITERKLHQEALQAINLDLAHSNEELATTNEELAQTHDDLIQYINKLSESDEKLRQAIDTGKMGTWSINPVTIEITLSSFVKETLGLQLDEPTTLDRIIEATNPQYRNMLTDILNNALKKHLPIEIEYPINNLNTGEEKWVRATGQVFLDKEGNPSEYSGLFMDITERKLDELRKNDFIGMVSHELKTPLTAINGFVQVLQRKAKLADDAYAINALDKANNQVKKMTTMINGFLNVSRLESGKLLIEKSTFKLDELLKEAIDETYISQSTHTVSLENGCEVEVYADRDKIGNVISNLLSNAHKYSANGSRIDVKCEIENDHVRVAIKDEGIGINADDANKLFERYYRVQGNHTISGFGIGLYLSAEIIDRHDGKIWVESELEKGSTFYFTLPINNR